MNLVKIVYSWGYKTLHYTYYNITYINHLHRFMYSWAIFQNFSGKVSYY